MRRFDVVKVAATFWGFVVFMPVGANYLGLFATAAALAAAGGVSERAARFRANPLAWPLAAYAGWTLFVLAVGPHYPETASNLWHGLRIASTLAITVLLSETEAVSALRGFVGGAAFALAAVVLSHTVGLPDFILWHNVIIMKGNKSINDALLFALLGAASAVLAMSWRSARHANAWRIALALVFPTAMAAIVIAGLPSRTSLVAMILALIAACVHQWRNRLQTLAVSLCIIGVATGAVLSQARSIDDKFRLGMAELEAAQTGTVSEGSLVVRFYMYRETTRMMLDRPWTGWGIGGWTQEWKRRSPPLLADYNMPHNDFLWMGSQAGVAGLLSVVAIFVAGLWVAWRRQDLAGRLALSAMSITLIATCLNSAMRDAAIGLSLPWVAFLFLRLVQAPGDPWRGFFGRLGVRQQPASESGGGLPGSASVRPGKPIPIPGSFHRKDPS